MAFRVGLRDAGHVGESDARSAWRRATPAGSGACEAGRRAFVSTGARLEPPRVARPSEPPLLRRDGPFGPERRTGCVGRRWPSRA